MGLQSNTSDFHVRTNGLKVNRPALKWKPAWFRQWRHSLVEKFDTQVLKWFECFGLWFSYRLLPTFPCRLKKSKRTTRKKSKPTKGHCAWPFLGTLCHTGWLKIGRWSLQWQTQSRIFLLISPRCHDSSSTVLSHLSGRSQKVRNEEICTRSD